jgi:hypothetical protein
MAQATKKKQRRRGAKREYSCREHTIFILKGKRNAEWYFYVEGPTDVEEDREKLYSTKWMAYNAACQLIYDKSNKLK